MSSHSQLPIVNINGYADQNDENIAPANTVNNTCKSKGRPAVDYKAQFESLAKRVRSAGLDLNPNISFKKQLESHQSDELKSCKVTIEDLTKSINKLEKRVAKKDKTFEAQASLSQDEM